MRARWRRFLPLFTTLALAALARPAKAAQADWSTLAEQENAPRRISSSDISFDLVVPGNNATAAPNEAVLTFNRWGTLLPELVRIDVTMPESVRYEKTPYSQNRTFTLEHMLSGAREDVHVPVAERGGIVSVVRVADGVELHSSNVSPGRDTRGALMTTLDLSPTVEESARVNMVPLSLTGKSSGRPLPEFIDTYRGVAGVALRSSDLPAMSARQHEVLMQWVDHGGTLFVACENGDGAICGELDTTRNNHQRVTTRGLGSVVYTKQPAAGEMFELARDEFHERRFSAHDNFGSRYFHFEEATYRTLGLAGLLLAFGIAAGPVVAWRRRRAGKSSLPLRWVAASSTLAFAGIALAGRAAAPSSHVEIVRVHTQTSGALHGSESILRTFFHPPPHLTVSRVGAFPIHDEHTERGERGAFYIDRDDKIVLNENGSVKDFAYVIEQSTTAPIDVTIDCHGGLQCVVHNRTGYVLRDVQFAHGSSLQDVAPRVGPEAQFTIQDGANLYGGRLYDAPLFGDLESTNRSLLIATIDLGKNESTILRIACGTRWCGPESAR